VWELSANVCPIPARARWYTPVIPALGRLRQEDLEFKGSLGYTVRLCLRKEKKKRNSPSQKALELWPQVFFLQQARLLSTYLSNQVLSLGLGYCHCLILPPLQSCLGHKPQQGDGGEGANR
jgi:hypothetical protein